MAARNSTYRPHRGQDGETSFDRELAERLYWEYTETNVRATAEALLAEVQKLAVAVIRTEFRSTARDEEDHVQHALMVAWKAIISKRVSQKGKFHSYLYTVLKRAVYDSLYMNHRAVMTIDYYADLQNAGLDPMDDHPFQRTVDDIDALRFLPHVLRRGSSEYRFPEHTNVYFAVVDHFIEHGSLPSFKDTQAVMKEWRSRDPRLYVLWFAAVTLANRILVKFEKELQK